MRQSIRKICSHSANPDMMSCLESGELVLNVDVRQRPCYNVVKLGTFKPSRFAAHSPASERHVIFGGPSLASKHTMVVPVALPSTPRSKPRSKDA